MSRTLSTLFSVVFLCFVAQALADSASQVAVKDPNMTDPAREDSFTIKICIPGTPVNPGASQITIRHGRITASDGKKEGHTTLSPGQIEALAEASKRFVESPGPFLLAEIEVRDGVAIFVTVSSKECARCTVLYGGPFAFFTPQVESLLKAMQKQLDPNSQGANSQDIVRRAIMSIREHGLPLGVAEKHGAEEMKKRVVIIENGTIEELVARVCDYKDPRWSENWIITSLYSLASAGRGAAGRLIYGELKKHPRWSLTTRVEVLSASIGGGCIEGLEEYAKLLKAVEPSTYHHGYDADGFMRRVCATDVVEKAIKEEKLGELNVQTAPRALAWLVKHRDLLEFDEDAGKFKLRAPG